MHTRIKKVTRRFVGRRRGFTGGDLVVKLRWMREFGPGHRFLIGKAGEGGHYLQPCLMYRGRRYAGYNKRVGTFHPIMRFQWRD